MKNAADSTDEYVIHTAEPGVEIENGKAVLSFYFSSALVDSSFGLDDVLAFARQVTMRDNDEVTLTIKVGLENIMDGVLDSIRYPGPQPTGEFHISEDYKGHVNLLKDAMLKAVEKLEKVQFHSERPDFGAA
jgi:hypothetical protein